MTSRQKPRVVRYLGTRPTGTKSTPPKKPESLRLQKLKSGSQSDYIETVTEESSSMSSASRNQSEDETTADVANVGTTGDGRKSFKVLSAKGQAHQPYKLQKNRKKEGRTDKSRPQTHPPEVVQRLLQERAVKITDLKSQVKYLSGKIVEVDHENELLRGVLKKQKSALTNFESPDKYFASMMKQHKDDVRELRGEIREENKGRDLDKEISEKSQQLWETNSEVSRLEQLIEKQLPGMEEGQRKLASAEDRLLRTTQKLSTLENEIEAATNFGRKRYVAEVVKHKETRESVTIMEEECEKIRLRIREREKELEIRNIYHQRIQQARNGVSKATTTDDLREHARLWREAEERERREVEERKRKEEKERKELEEMKRLEEAKRQAEIDKMKRIEESERKRQEERMKHEQEEKERMEKELRELEERERKEREKKAREERRRRERAERDVRERKRRENERTKKQKAKQRAEEEARLAREEAGRKAKEESERKAREEAERQAREEAEKHAREEAERQAREEAERKAREEAREEAEEKVRYLQAQLRRVETLIKEKTEESLKKKKGHKTKRTFQNLHAGMSSQGPLSSSSGASNKTN
ncbi:LCA5 [Branchiostoma lanceolatum]|uniref:LCA5 protein n=1 Tax=Branchiostoma lanceolatum TaxID=7740 RepID=A0A8J9VT01_BRALA|nr:LCA5 [Branchiostoma lanceolatum]